MKQNKNNTPCMWPGFIEWTDGKGCQHAGRYQEGE